MDLIEAKSGKSVSRAEFDALVETFATQLKSPHKQLVMITTANRIGIIAAIYGAWLADHAVLLVDASMPMQNQQRLIDIYKPDHWLFPDDVLAEGKSMGQGIKHAAFTNAKKDIHPDLHLLLTTSGSTGDAKLVRLSKKNLKTNTADIISALGVTAQDRTAAHMPLAYSYGLSVVETHLSAGASLVLIEDSMTEKNFWEAIRKYNVTTLPGVPTHFQIMHRLGFDRLNVPSVKNLTQAGGRLAKDLVIYFAEAMQKRGGKFFAMYGQTEASPRMTVLPAADALTKPDSVGLPVAQGSLTIEGDEVIYIGPNIMMGYATNRDDLALGDLTHGRLATGDVGHLDKDGYLYITGRRANFAKIDGLRINLDEVEHIASKLAPTAAIEHNEQIILLTTGDAASMQDHISKHIQINPSRVTAKHIAELPLLANGKLDRQALRKFL